MIEDDKGPERPFRWALFIALLLLITMAAAYISLISPISLRGPVPKVALGQVAAQDMRAPKKAEFVSRVLTEQAQLQAERSVSPVYSAPDESIARAQIDKLRQALNQIDEIRSDPTLLVADKQQALAKVSGLQLKPGTIAALLSLSDSRWTLVQQESLRLLEQLMRQPVLDDTVESMRSGIPSQVTLALTGDQAQMVADLVSPFIMPNSFYSPELTDQARQAARVAIQPVTRSYLAGEIVVQRGTVISDADLEALTALGMVEPAITWENLLGALALVAVLAAFICLYFWRRKPAVMRDPGGMLLIAISFIIFLVGARLAIPGRTIVPYLYPLPAFALLMAALFGMEPAIVFSIPLALLAPYGLSAYEDLPVFYMLASFCGAMALLPARRVSQFLRGALVIALAGTAVVIAYRLPFTDWDWQGLTTLAGAALFNGVASASVALLVQFFVAQTIGFTTPLHLLEVSRPDHPLLQLVLRKAPGTYQHSLMVANVAEQAADAMGADSLLVRVGALYHDCGKSTNPLFFIENQSPDSLDPHHEMDPLEAARTVIKHIPDGLVLARKYRLPRRVRDFIAEHHGTLITRYQYGRALEAAGGDASKVDMDQFRYPGPTPRSRETAILMLADMTEARLRAERPPDEEALRKMIQQSIDICQKNGQLDATRLTLRDLHLIAESFTSSLQGTYHPRIAYPSTEPLVKPEGKGT